MITHVTSRPRSTRTQAFAALLSDGLAHPAFYVYEFDFERCTATVEAQNPDGRRRDMLYDLTAADVTRGLRLFRKRLVVERVPKNAAAWQTVRYGQTGGAQGDYTADTAAAVVQLAVYGEVAFA